MAVNSPPEVGASPDISPLPAVRASNAPMSDNVSNHSTSKALRTLITVATYNERENLPLLVDEILRLAPNVDLLVIDDNSPDGTGAWCDEQILAEPRLRCLHRSGKLGLGTAIIAGMKYAIEHGYDCVLNMDADFSHHPRYLPDILKAAEAPLAAGFPADVVIGSRYVPGGKIEGWPWKRHFMSRAVNTYARLLLRLPSRDCSGAFRLYRTDLLKRLNLDGVKSKGYSFQEEILWHARRAGATFCEVPITFADRTRGQSKINWREAYGALWVIFRLGLSGLFGRKPPQRGASVSHRQTPNAH